MVREMSAGDVIIGMAQTFGSTWDVVEHKLTGNSKYEVRTPASTASVRGTGFKKKYDPVKKLDSTETVDGVVSSALPSGASVNVTPGKLGEVTQGATQIETPKDAPEPPATVKIVLDASNTKNA